MILKIKIQIELPVILRSGGRREVMVMQNHYNAFKTWIKALIGSPFEGLTYWLFALTMLYASAREISSCGKCTFISSPSKSALYVLKSEQTSEQQISELIVVIRFDYTPQKLTINNRLYACVTYRWVQYLHTSHVFTVLHVCALIYSSSYLSIHALFIK